ncbi:MAG: radical SAM protein [Deltaproteobacteria bacterium]|nr:radical SAM protein [Deltaproteobacteria bacterium]
MNFDESYKFCELCPRRCGVNRTRGIPGRGPGFCGETDQIRVAYVGPHFGEEPPITGILGSGTVFFSGCSLKCAYCQNYQISHRGLGQTVSFHSLIGKIRQMIHAEKIHNLNFVTPDHFLPHVVRILQVLKKEYPLLPAVFNFSGYQSLETLKRLEGYADIYLPDFKYSDPSLAQRLSGCADYPEQGIDAISLMIRQKGFLNASLSEGALATRGVMVRHLILPGAIENSIKALTILFIEFGPDLPLSLMSQYQPVLHNKDSDLNRPLRRVEFDEVFDHAKQLGFLRMYVQLPEFSEGGLEKRPSFLPDFRNRQPFEI